jgi:hypothetical protein
MFTAPGTLAVMSQLVYIYCRGPRYERGISMNSLGIPIQAGGIAQKSNRAIEEAATLLLFGEPWKTDSAFVSSF